MDLATAQTNLATWLAADQAVATGQAYSVAGRSLTRVDAATIRQQITYWQRIVDGYTAAAAGATAPRVTLASFN